MSTGSNHIELMLAVFSAVERRDAQQFTELVHPDFEIHWPPSLPYGGAYRDLDIDAQLGRPTWAETWNPLQPSPAERRMDPRVIAANDESGEVVVLWQQRGAQPHRRALRRPSARPLHDPRWAARPRPDVLLRYRRADRLPRKRGYLRPITCAPPEHRELHSPTTSAATLLVTVGPQEWTGGYGIRTP
jgi:ketosteroid isomerase-like protein